MAKTGPKLPAEEALLQSRVIKILNWILAGVSPYKIFQIISEPPESWGITERTMWNYIRRANEIFAEEASFKKKEQFGKAMQRLNMLFLSCYKISDYKSCLAIQIEINKLLGLYSPEVIEIKKTSIHDTMAKINEYQKLLSGK